MNVHYAKHYAVTDPVETLSEFVERIASINGWSNEFIAKRGGLSRTTVWNIRNNTYKHVGVGTLQCLAVGLETSEDTLFKLARKHKISPSEREQALRKKTETRKIRASAVLWDRLDADARRCNRTTEEQFTAILSLYLGLGESELKGFDAAKQDRPNPAEVTELLHKQNVDVDFATVVRVLNDDAPDISTKLKNKILAAAGLPHSEDETNGEDSASVS
jgi:transcriptional regulator with XRE-family HTH domain